MSKLSTDLEITAASLFVHAVNRTTAMMGMGRFVFILVCFEDDVLFVETKLGQQCGRRRR